MSEIHWYPGHMAKAKRQFEEVIRYLDLILEIRDARIPLSSHNGDLQKFLKRKPNIVVLNKQDLADPAVTRRWVAWLAAREIPAIPVEGRDGAGFQTVWSTLNQRLQSSNGKKSLKIGVIGIPNVGKSSILNRLIGSGSAKTGNRPGVTRGKQWVRQGQFEILDTPGLLPPKIADEETGFKLALVGTIREEIIPVYDLALYLLDTYGKKLDEKMTAICPENGDSTDWLAAFAKQRGLLRQGGNLDLERGAQVLLKEFRDGKLGRISLEEPGELL